MKTKKKTKKNFMISIMRLILSCHSVDKSYLKHILFFQPKSKKKKIEKNKKIKKNKKKIKKKLKKNYGKN